MILVYLLACIGLFALMLLAGLFLTTLALYAREEGEPEDAFDLAASAVSNIHAGAWQAIQELRGATDREE